MTRAQGKHDCTTVGEPVQRLIARYKARMIARYGLVSVKGRPEELRDPNGNEAVSIQYGCMQIRIRPMNGRKWFGNIDLPADRLDWEKVTQVLDPWFDKPADGLPYPRPRFAIPSEVR